MTSRRIFKFFIYPFYVTFNSAPIILGFAMTERRAFSLLLSRRSARRDTLELTHRESCDLIVQFTLVLNPWHARTTCT